MNFQVQAGQIIETSVQHWTLLEGPGRMLDTPCCVEQDNAAVNGERAVPLTDGRRRRTHTQAFNV